MTAAITSATASAAAAATPQINANFNMFLSLLTTQLKNQDPMNPTDPSDLAVQLATFSGVEQQTQTNTLLQGIGGQVSQMGMSQLAGWVGMEARAVAPTAFSGAPITLCPQPETGADAAALLVTDAKGKLVATLNLPASAGPIQWDGRDADGKLLPSGTYSFALESYAGGKLIGTDPVESYARVIEAQSGTDGPLLVLDSGATVAASAVTGLRAGG